jgi:hypothetical protein
VKFGDDLYGWGVFDIPIEREARLGGSPQRKSLGGMSVRPLLRDVPWRAGGASTLLAVLCLIGLLFLERNSPMPPAPSEPEPVEVAVRLLEEVPTVAQPLVEELPVLPEERVEAVVLEAPPPVPAEISPDPEIPPPPPPPEKIVRTAPAKPPEPIRVKPPPANMQLPPPSPQPVRERRPQERPALPEEKAQIAARQEAVLPDPGRSSYEERPDPASASLPKRTAALRNEASLDLGEGPQRVRAAERGTAKATLPESPAMTLDRSDETILDDAAPRMNARYEKRADSPAVPPSLPQGTVPPGGEEADISLPKATAFAVPGSLKAVAMLPSAERRDSPLAGIGRNADPDLTGPSVQKASLPKARARWAPDAPGNSYEFLDLVRPEELDRSVMVSLNRLRTCLDPNEELTLKTRLAAMLSRPGQCRAGGVVFDIRNPESAYSIHVDLYNYEQKEFQDRCSALRLAVYSCEARR